MCDMINAARTRASSERLHAVIGPMVPGLTYKAICGVFVRLPVSPWSAAELLYRCSKCHRAVPAKEVTGG